MTNGQSGVIAGCFALSAFIVAIVAGLTASNPAVTILVRAVMAMVICWPVGMGIALLCRRVIESHEIEQSSGHPGADDAPADVAAHPAHAAQGDGAQHDVAAA